MSELPDMTEAPVGYRPPQQSNTTVTVLMLIIGLLVFCLCVLPICVIVILAMLGPSIGNIFSSIIEDLVTPTPMPSLILPIVMAIMWRR